MFKFGSSIKWDTKTHHFLYSFQSYGALLTTYTEHTHSESRNSFHSEIASKFHKQSLRNGKNHIELNAKFWSRKTDSVFLYNVLQ